MTTPRVLRPVTAPPEPEKGFQNWVVDYARLRGWEHYHPFLSIRSPRGWPDLALCRPPRLVLAELKGTTGKLTPAQQHWAELLDACPGVEMYVWWPRHRDNITRILR